MTDEELEARLHQAIEQGDYIVGPPEGPMGLVLRLLDQARAERDDARQRCLAREPTEKMIEAGENAGAGDGAKRIWRRMYDQAMDDRSGTIPANATKEFWEGGKEMLRQK